jgi:hypothetical protein
MNLACPFIGRESVVLEFDFPFNHAPSIATLI